ncbi:MAG TPA: PAS domain S-box protein [Hanamia sp.]|jgi:PAS domain S-box-containing protein|nr:PAS domain S-box protein [Hanamia sp.]
MKISRYFIVIISIILLSFSGLFYFISQNHKKTTKNALEVNQLRKTAKTIDEAFYTISALERNTQKFVITGDEMIEKNAENETADLHKIIVQLDEPAKSNPGGFAFLPLLIKKLDNQQYIRQHRLNAKEITVFLKNNDDEKESTSFYESVNETKQSYINKINQLLAKSQAIEATNFKSSLLVCLVSILLIIITLVQETRNKRLRKLAEKDTRQIGIQYKNLVDNSGVGLLTTDLNGNITFVNKRIKTFTGFEPSEIIGKHFSSLVDTEWAQTISEKLRKQLLRRQEESDITYPLIVKSGNRIWVEQSTAILMENDEPQGFQCIVKDITEKRRIEEEFKKIKLEREEHQFRLQSILDNTPLIIFIKDLKGRYLLANKSFKDAFHFTSEQIIGKTDFDLVAESDAKRYKEVDEYVITKHKHVEIEENIEQAGVTKNLLIVKFPLFDKNNTIYGISGIASDITERYLYGLHLIEAKRKAEMAERLQEQFLANMSHDIRTPMNGIIGMTNILLNTSMSGEQKDFLNTIKKSSDSLMILINDILDLSKIKAGKLRIENIDFRLRETLEQTISTFRVLINDKGLKLRVSVDLDIPDSLTGDPHRLNQILNNLISNAVKFTAAGEINLEIKALYQSANEIELSFSVSDTGIGIANEKIESIFESFSQAESGTSRKFGGSGLGLSITKQLIEMQNGSIQAKSRPGEGTEFNFTIKYAIPAHVVAKQYDVKQETLSEGGLSGKRVLVVEDNEANQKVIYHMLDKVGIEADLADNGKVAIKLLEDGFQYDLIIMDLQMPEMDGFETTKYIRQNLKLTLPIIAMTASALRNEKIKCMEVGMNEYLNKPFIPADLFRELRRFLLKKEEEASDNNDSRIHSESKKLYSLNHLIELDDMDCLCEVLQIFLESTPVMMGEIKESIAAKDWEEVYKKSHKLKSSIGILQMGKLMSVVSKIESDAKEKKNLQEIPGNFEKAEELLLQINPMIKEELENALEMVLKN